MQNDRRADRAKVIAKVEPHFPSRALAFAWFITEPLAGFAGRTAKQLVEEGRVEDVIRYIDSVDAGSHA